MPIWLVLVWRRGRPARAQDGVRVQGLFRSSIGIGQGARLFADAMEVAGFSIDRVDAGAWTNTAADLDLEPQGEGGGRPVGLTVSHLNPSELERVVERAWARAQRGRRHIGYWAWELPTAPTSWRRGFRFVDEVWTPSAFTADALSRIAPASVPVHVVPHPVWATTPGAADRAGFGLPEQACVVLVALDLRSTGARKNPLGALQTYAAATARTSTGATLVCKVSGASAEPALFAQVKALCSDRFDVVLIDAVLSHERMSALVASADIVLSPHRAEGFGLLLAEGMRLGKAVVATGWSGNMEFMDATCAALIDYRLTPVFDPQGLYVGSEWAEPDLGHAARLLARLIDSPDERAALGARARARGGPTFDMQLWRQLIERRMTG